MSAPGGAGASDRTFRAVLRLYPPGFRADEGVEVLEAFRRLRREASTPRERRRVTLRAVRGAVAGLLPAWIEAARDAARGGRPGWASGGALAGAPGSLRTAVRTLGRSPAFTVTATLLVALGVGAVTTIFTLVDHVLLRALPYPAADRLVYVDNGSHSGPRFRDFQEGTPSVEAWAAAWADEVVVTGVGEPVQLTQSRISSGFFAFFGGSPAAGRLLTAADEGRAVAVLSHGTWERLWGADPDVVGRTVRIDGSPHVVVGVVGADFIAPTPMRRGGTIGLWRPLDFSLEELGSRSTHVLAVAGRLRPGATVEGADREVAALMGRLAEVHPEERRRDGAVREVPVVPLHEVATRDVRGGLALLMGAVMLLLLVACANVAHLFLARGLGRLREMAVRRALGAGVAALLRQLVAESVVVAVAGGALGVALAHGGVTAMVRWAPGRLERMADVSVDPRVLAFGLVLALATAVVFGLLPALQALGRDPADELRGAGRGATASRGAARVRGGLVIAEVGLSLVLLSGAGLFLRSFQALRTVEPGVRTADVTTLPLAPTSIASPDDWRRTAREVAEALSAVPGVESTAYGLTMPLEVTGGSRCCWGLSVTVPDAPGVEVGAVVHPVSTGYFGLFDIAFEAGAPWRRDREATEPLAAVLDRAAAVAAFGSPGAAVGRTVTIRSRPFRVTGVAAPVRHYGLDQDAGPAVYVPPAALPFTIPLLHLAVRTRPGAAPPAAALREAVWGVAPDLPVPTVRTLTEWSTASTARARFESLVFGVFAATALLLAAGGLYGTLLYTVGQRRREMGIRLALGARGGRIARRVVGSGLRLGGAGVALGLAGAWAGGRLLESRLFGVRPHDPAVLLAATGALLAAVLVASWIPAHRAARTDPVRTLAAE